MLCTFQNGKIRPKQSFSSDVIVVLAQLAENAPYFRQRARIEPIFHQENDHYLYSWDCPLIENGPNADPGWRPGFPRWMTIILYSWARPFLENGCNGDPTEYTASWRTCFRGCNTLHCACTRYTRAGQCKRKSWPFFRNRPLWVLKLASPMISTSDNGKIRPKQSSSGKVIAVLSHRAERAINAIFPAARKDRDHVSRGEWPWFYTLGLLLS